MVSLVLLEHALAGDSEVGVRLTVVRMQGAEAVKQLLVVQLMRQQRMRDEQH